MRAATAPAQRPPDAKLLVVDPDGRIDHARRSELARFLHPGDLLVANDSATLPASLTGFHRRSGAGIEVRLAGRRSLEPDDVQNFTAIVFGSGDHRTPTERRPPPPQLREGDTLALGPLLAVVTGSLGHPRAVTLGFEGGADAVWKGIARHGRPVQYAHLFQPLELRDTWTRIAALPTSFEPPSASFLIDWALLGRLRLAGVAFATLTHAAGLSSTGDEALDALLPLDEPYHIPQATADAIAVAQDRGGRVVALGTTVTRALEHAVSIAGRPRAGVGLADQRIGPDTVLRVVDAVVSGVHQPGESHYDLLRAFVEDADLERMSVALERSGYRTHEYGDSVLVARARRGPAGGLLPISTPGVTLRIMPLVAHSPLPTFGHLRAQGHELLSLERALHQDIRELHIGFLNMMPDGALEASERQFIRLVGSCNRIAQFFVYPFSLPGLARSDATLEYIERYYSKFDDLREKGLDALIITGANVSTPDISQEPFWGPLVEVMDWAQENVTSVLCSCLATHALLRHFHGIERQPLPQKRWGVYSHRVCEPGHPMLRDINTRFDAPHSRYNDISRAQLEAAGLKSLAESADGGVLISASPDQFRIIYFQGHPEYDFNSLLKEYKREAQRFLRGELAAPPRFPDHYLSAAAAELAADWIDDARRARDAGEPPPAMPASEIEALLDNTWSDTAKAIVANWLGLVYRLTNLDRKKQFMAGVDPGNPLGLLPGST